MRIKAPTAIEVNGAAVRDVHLPHININTANLNGGTEISVHAFRFVEFGGRRIPLGDAVQSLVPLGQIQPGDAAQQAAIASSIDEQLAASSEEERSIGQVIRQIAEAAGGDAAAYANVAAVAVYMAKQALVTAGIVQVDPTTAETEEQ